MSPTRRTLRPVAALAAAGALFLSACGDDGQSGEDVTADVVVAEEEDLATATDEAAVPEHGQADIDYATGMLAHHKQMIALADLGLEQGTEEIDGLAAELRSYRSEDAEELAATLEMYGQSPAEADTEAGEELSGLSGEEFDAAWLDRVYELNDEAITLIDEQQANGIDATLNRTATELEEVVVREMSDIDLLREALGQR